jgi:hypothetical protein
VQEGSGDTAISLARVFVSDIDGEEFEEASWPASLPYQLCLVTMFRKIARLDSSALEWDISHMSHNFVSDYESGPVRFFSLVVTQTKLLLLTRSRVPKADMGRVPLNGIKRFHVDTSSFQSFRPWHLASHLATVGGDV